MLQIALGAHGLQGRVAFEPGGVAQRAHRAGQFESPPRFLFKSQVLVATDALQTLYKKTLIIHKTSVSLIMDIFIR